MAPVLSLPFGSSPFEIDLPPDSFVANLPESRPGEALEPLLAAALDNPIGSPSLETLGRDASAVVVAVSDTTRNDPRNALVRAVLQRIDHDVDLTIAIANGTHGRCDINALGIDQAILGRATIVNHDAYSDRELVLIGTTKRGTPVRLHRCVLDADLVVATGRIKPHYFAGYGAGIKTIFPGLGGNREVRINHALKAEALARAGVVDGNPCREDLEEVADLIEVPLFLLNIVVDGEGGAQAAVAGDVRAAFRRGAQLCRPLYEVRAPKGDLIVVSDRLPLTGSLYQASKLAAAAAPLVREGGAIVVVAECPLGVGPLDTVNKAIYEIGIKPRLPDKHAIFLVSGLSEAEVSKTYCRWLKPSPALCRLVSAARPVILPRAGAAIVVPFEDTE